VFSCVIAKGELKSVAISSVMSFPFIVI